MSVCKVSDKTHRSIVRQIFPLNRASTFAFLGLYMPSSINFQLTRQYFARWSQLRKKRRVNADSVVHAKKPLHEKYGKDGELNQRAIHL